jgi:hypothetical protein
MNNHLVPEVRADVNGKLVTRHVKSGAAIPSTASLPAPPSLASFAANYVSNIEALTEALDSAIDTGAFDEVDMVEKDVLYRTLQNMQPHVVEAWRRQIDDNSDIGYEDLLISVLVNKLNAEQAGYILFAIQNSGENYSFNAEWDDDVQGTYDYEHAWNAYRGITDFYARTQRSQPKDILKADAQDYQDSAAVAKMLVRGYVNEVTGVLMDDDNDAVIFEDIDLGVLATEYPDDIETITQIMSKHEITDVPKMRNIMNLKDEFPESLDRIMAIMDERNTIDPETIREVLEAEVQPLSNGIL